jgi:hypothetical protein
LRSENAAWWVGFALLAMCIGALLGLAADVWSSRAGGTNEQLAGQRLPVVEFSERDYSAVNGVVPGFGRWAHGAIYTHFSQVYPPDQISLRRQRAFYEHIVSTATEHGEIENVIDAAALRAINEANAEQAVETPSTERKGAVPETLLIYAQKASYYGQDVWCFLAFTTLDHQHTTARVLVVASVPPWGLIHTQIIGTPD